MKFKILLWLQIFSVAATLCYGQNKPLKQGQALPAVTIRDLYNTSLKSLTMNHFKGKIIVIDFWSTWCPSCIAGLKRIDTLQRKFNKDVIFLPVTFQAKAVVEKFWRKNAITQNLKLLTAINDRQLSNLFPHQGEPFEVWIDKNGRFLGATDLEYVNEREISNLIKGGKPHWVTAMVKQGHDFASSMKINSDKKLANDNYYSMFTGNSPMEKTDFKFTVDSIRKTIKITFINYNIAGLYWTSFQAVPEMQNPKRYTWNIRDRSKFKYEKSYGYITQWHSKNTWCYELFWPLDDSCHVEIGFRKMRADLDAFFHLKSTIRDSTSQYLQLAKIAVFDSLRLTRNRAKDEISLGSLVDIWNSDATFPIILNNLKESERIFLGSEMIPMRDIDLINSKLRTVGLELESKNGPLPHFFLTDALKE